MYRGDTYFRERKSERARCAAHARGIDECCGLYIDEKEPGQVLLALDLGG